MVRSWAGFRYISCTLAGKLFTFASATANFTHSFVIEDYNAIRVKAKQTGGSATGNTLALQYAVGTYAR